MKDFEKRLVRLEEISEKIRDGQVPLEEAADLFEEGMKLSRSLDAELRTLERRIEILVNEPSGPSETPILELFPELSGDAAKDD